LDNSWRTRALKKPKKLKSERKKQALEEKKQKNAGNAHICVLTGF